MTAADPANTVRDALIAAQEVSRIESTGVLPDFMPLAVALRNDPFAALDALEAQAERQGRNIHALYKQKRAAEARVTELETALRQIADYGHEADDYDAPASRTRALARAALATEHTQDTV